MTESDRNSELQEPAAIGREAFWAGRPVWANPFVGAVARAWKTGWVQGQAELVSRAGDCALTAPEAEQQGLLQLHRPEDLSSPSRTLPRRSRSRVRRTASYDETYAPASL